MAIKHFENSVSNTRDKRTLCVAGIVATLADGVYTPIDAYPGMLVTPSALVPSSAYANVNNPNTWYMVAANADTTIKDVYVVCPDVASFGQAGAYVNGFNAGIYNLGMETLGVPQPAGEATRCIKLEELSLYTWGDYWFASAPSATNKYAVLNANGLWAPASTAPQSGMYFEYLETVSFTVGAYAGGTGYYGQIKTV